MVEDFLAKEVASGNLTKLSNGNYSLVDGTDLAVVAHQNHKVTSTTATSTPIKEERQQARYELNEELGDEEEQDSRLVGSMKKEECYEIIVGGRRPSDEEESSPRESNGE